MTETLHPIDKPSLFFISLPNVTFYDEHNFATTFGTSAKDIKLKRHSHCVFDANAPCAGPTADGFTINGPALLKLLKIMTANETGVHRSIQGLFQSGDDQYQAYVWFLDVGTHIANDTKPLPHEYDKLRKLEQFERNF